MACSIGFAACGHSVIGYDVIRERIRGLQRGQTPYNEDGLAAALTRQLRAGRLNFVEELAAAVGPSRFIVITVGTPTTDSGEADLSFLKTAIESLAALDLRGKTIVLRSTVPPGTTDRIRNMLGDRVGLVYSPEFFREGSAVRDFMHPDRIVVGAYDQNVAQAYAAILESIDAPVYITSPRESELVKNVSNGYLALKISFANEIADMCDKLGADALKVLEAVGADRRIGGASLAPGIGFGGPCFDKDLRSIVHTAVKVGAARDLFESTLRVNWKQPRRVIAKLRNALGGSFAGAHIGVWGLTFKAGTDDVRHSLAISMVDALLEEGASVRAFDPAVGSSHVLVRCELAASALDVLDADALLVLTDWPEFKNVPAHAIAARLRKRIVVDGRNALDGAALSANGVDYYGVGRGLTTRRSTFTADKDTEIAV
jgi:UDPglucose 6-dehydrogenase